MDEVHYKQTPKQGVTTYLIGYTCQTSKVRAEIIRLAGMSHAQYA